MPSLIFTSGGLTGSLLLSTDQVEKSGGFWGLEAFNSLLMQMPSAGVAGSAWSDEPTLVHVPELISFSTRFGVSQTSRSPQNLSSSIMLRL
jgi:hypothetical protein